MAHYDLEDVRQAAKSCRIQYHGRRVGVDIAELGYQLGDVAQCLAALTADEFHKTHVWNDLAFDAYITRFARPGAEDEVDELYVKFALLDDCLMIHLGSFHLPRFG